MNTTQTGNLPGKGMVPPGMPSIGSGLSRTGGNKNPRKSKQGKADAKYSEAVSNGHYDIYRGGLSGKHDNVRTYWEDQFRGLRLRPHLQTLVDRKKRAGEGLRIVDLGAGTGEGLRLLTSILREGADLRHTQDAVLPEDLIQLYLGSDLCEAMVEQGNENYADRADIVFQLGDFSNGFPHRQQKPFDLYFCSYGSFSHIDDEAMERLFADISDHAGSRALVVGEWLGRHSIEWPCYWDQAGGQMLDYSMSWLTTESSDEPEHFPMRYRLGQEVRDMVKAIARQTQTKISVLDLYDCSIFTGRHADTREYNEWVRPVRSAVNCLHEANVRTDLNLLKAEFVPVPGHDALNGFFGNLQFCWNSLVEYCQRRLEKRQNLVRIKNWSSFPPALQMAIMTLDRVIDTVSWMRMGDPRANIIEPQLGYVLRSLELEFQTGSGCGHSLVGIFEIRKG